MIPADDQFTNNLLTAVKTEIDQRFPHLVIPILQQYLWAHRMWAGLKCAQGKRDTVYYSNQENPRTIHIDPSQIKIRSQTVFDSQYDAGAVRGGNWDLRTDPLNNPVEELDRSPETERNSENISVNIGRHGNILLNQGSKTLRDAQEEDRAELLARVVVRHHDWQLFRDEVAAFRDARGGEIYNTIPHPDFDTETTYGSDVRFEPMISAVNSEGGKLLDIGSKWGYFCHKFEQLGFDCYAVEHKPSNIYFMRRLRRASNRSFTPIQGDIFQIDMTDMEYSVVLALNIFHHFIKTPELYDQFLNLLADLNTKEMFFQSVAEGEAQMEGAYRNLAGDEFAQFIINHSSLQEWTYLGTPENDGRKLYHLTI